MLFRFSRIAVAFAAVAAVWWFAGARASRPQSALPALGSHSGPVRILRFYATAGVIQTGQKAQLCYGVENARSVWIAPELDGVYPSPNHCLEVVPERTTHYTILAEGFDGVLATRSFTLAVHPPMMKPLPVQYAAM